MPFSFVLLLALAVPQNVSNAPTPDALTLLKEVSRRYADAKSYHIEAVEERASSDELRHDWQKTLLSATLMPGGRYRYEGRSSYDSAVLVSDGTIEWDYHAYEHVYTKHPSAKNAMKDRVISHQEMAAEEASSLVSEIARRAHPLKLATFLPDEDVTLDDSTIQCYVVHYSSKDFKTRRDDLERDETLWIDKSRKVVIKTVTRREAYLLDGPDVRIPIHEQVTVTYPVVEFDPPQLPGTFAFVAPPGAKLVAEFPDPFSNQRGLESENSLGKPAPELTLVSDDGKIATLSAFRGKPVFIEFWATWCGPCVELTPELNKLYSETASNGLAWISVDSDEDAADAAKFMSVQHIPWPNYHDADGSFGKAFQREGIPLGVLIDADGKVAFYETGYEISDLRSAIAKLGPQFSSVALAKTSAK